MFLYFLHFDVSFIVLSQTVDRNSLLEEEVKIVPPNEGPPTSEKVFRSYTTACCIAMARVFLSFSRQGFYSLPPPLQSNSSHKRILLAAVADTSYFCSSNGKVIVDKRIGMEEENARNKINTARVQNEKEGGGRRRNQSRGKTSKRRLALTKSYALNYKRNTKSQIKRQSWLPVIWSSTAFFLSLSLSFTPKRIHKVTKKLTDIKIRLDVGFCRLGGTCNVFDSTRRARGFLILEREEDHTGSGQ